jgi:hypothetical protein
MLRYLYRCALRLHPSSFRRRFGDEMLSIFDQQKRKLAAFGLMLDCVVSLLRQRTLRSNTGTELQAASLRCPPADHIPLFESFGSFQPRTSAMIHGALLSLILFCMTAFGIRYSWIHVLNIHIPEIGANPTEPPSGNSKNSSEHAQVDVIPTDADGPQSKAIVSNSARSSDALVGSRGATIWLDQYVGKYVSNDPPAKIWIQIGRDPFQGDHLSLSFAASGHPGLALSPESPTRFVVAGAENSYVDFTTDIRGKIFGLSLVEGANVINARRQ